jgi:hypothetical protein
MEKGMANEPVLAADALAWEADLSKWRPRNFTRDEAMISTPVPSFTVQGVDLGALVRFPARNGGTIDIFLNAAVAVQLINALCDIGQRARWRNEDGSLIVRDPENLRHPGPQA